jgi:hypothetical protein
MTDKRARTLARSTPKLKTETAAVIWSRSWVGWLDEVDDGMREGLGWERMRWR